MKPTVLIPTPLLFSNGIRVGAYDLVIPVGFFNIVTLVSPKEYFKSASVIIFLVLPSRIRSLGATPYPRPPEVIPILVKLARDWISIIWGNNALGSNVESDGKVYPISSISVVLIFPTEELDGSTTAPLPTVEVIVVIPGME